MADRLARAARWYVGSWPSEVAWRSWPRSCSRRRWSWALSPRHHRRRGVDRRARSASGPHRPTAPRSRRPVSALSRASSRPWPTTPRSAALPLGRRPVAPSTRSKRFGYFGVLLVGDGAPPPVTWAAGAAYHVFNGITFAIAYAQFFGGLAARSPGRAILSGMAWGVMLETFQLALFPGWLSIQFIAEFATISFAAHLVYGTSSASSSGAASSPTGARRCHWAYPHRRWGVPPDRTGGALCATRHHPAERASRAGPCRPYDAGPTALRRSARGSRPDRRARDLEHPLLRAVVPALAVLREDPRRRLHRLRHLQPHVPARATTAIRSRSTGTPQRR